MKSRKIIAILGLPGSGKTEAIKYLAEKYGWPKVYFGEPTFDELRRLKLPFTEKNEKRAREKLRKKYGSSYYGEQAVEKVKKIGKNKNILLESFYTWDEYLLFKKKFPSDFLTIAIYAKPKIRYKRLEKRKARPLNSKEAQGRDYAQIENLSQGGPIAMADYIVINEGSKKDLHNQIDEIINQILKN